MWKVMLSDTMHAIKKITIFVLAVVFAISTVMAITNTMLTLFGSVHKIPLGANIAAIPGFIVLFVMFVMFVLEWIDSAKRRSNK